MGEIFDKRSQFFRECFDRGKSYESYVATGDAGQQERWRGYERRLRLSEPDAALLRSFQRSMNVLVLSGVWCGDCMRQCPMLSAIEQAALSMTVRYLDNNEYPELRDELRILGGARVPVVLTLSEDFFEAARLGDRTLSAYRRKAALELGPACDSGYAPPSDVELAAELHEWVEHFERTQLMLKLSPMLRRRHND